MARENLRLSFEFYPPKTEKGQNSLREQRVALAALSPDFFSVTYGAGGSTREHTKEIVLDIKSEGFSVAPHLSFGGDEEEQIVELLNAYQAAGIDRLVALRGDIPSGMGMGQLVYANELVEFIREKTGDHFQIEVAAYPEIHPQAESYGKDLVYLKGKFDAGADNAITQYFYTIDSYLYFVDACQQIGITNPIYPGIMPITNFTNLKRFSESCGAEIPRWMSQRIESFGQDQESISAFGVEVVTRLCEKLLRNDAPGLHFYTMNQSEPTVSICKNLGLA